MSIKTVGYLERPHPNSDGIQKIYRFENGYGASAVRFKLGSTGAFGRTYGSYTDNENEWEVAVVWFENETIDSFSVQYGTPITSDVIGHVKDGEELEILLLRISELSKEEDDVNTRK